MPHGNSKKVQRWRDRLRRGRAGVLGTRGQGQVPGVGLVHLSSISPCTVPWVLPPLIFPPRLPEFLSSVSSSSLTSSWDFLCLHSAFPRELHPSPPSCISHSFQPSQAPSERGPHLAAAPTTTSPSLLSGSPHHACVPLSPPVLTVIHQDKDTCSPCLDDFSACLTICLPDLHPVLILP